MSETFCIIIFKYGQQADNYGMCVGCMQDMCWTCVGKLYRLWRPIITNYYEVAEITSFGNLMNFSSLVFIARLDAKSTSSNEINFHISDVDTYLVIFIVIAYLILVAMETVIGCLKHD